jgi:hypothetical protein
VVRLNTLPEFVSQPYNCELQRQRSKKDNATSSLVRFENVNFTLKKRSGLLQSCRCCRF